ncbi:MAG: monovalent cation:proton antiporter family protein [Candidatus Abyssubacteria bacterium]
MNMNDPHAPFIPLLIVIGLAFVVPILLSRLKRVFIPIVIGEIIAGMVVGQSGLGIVQESDVLRILSDLGFAFLLFLSGLEIDFSGLMTSGAKTRSRLRRVIGNHLFLGVATFACTLILAAGAAWSFKRLGLIQDPWVMALVLSTTSLGELMSILKERGLTGDRYGQLILISSMVADFSSILLISVYVLLRSRGVTAELLLILILLAAFVAVYRVASLFQRHLPAERFFEELSSATSQIRLRGSLALALVFIVLAETLGIENILGAFLAGVIVSMLSEREGSLLREKLDAIGYGFFVPIFFVMVGVGFDLPALIASPGALLLLPMLVATAYVVKVVPSLLFRIEYSWKETLSAGVLLSARLSLLIAAASIGLDMGAISEAVYSAIILLAIFTCTVSPIVFNALGARPPKEKDRVVVIGCRKLAELLVQRLREHGQNAILICTDANREGIPAMQAQKHIADALRDAEIEKARLAVVMEEQDENNLRIVRMVRVMFGVKDIIAWVQDPAKNVRFRQLGARVVNPAYSTLLILEGMALNPDAFARLPDADEAMEIRETKLKNESLIGKRLDEIDLPPEVAILMIQRDSEMLVPERNTTLAHNDVITVTGPLEDVNRALLLFSSGKMAP